MKPIKKLSPPKKPEGKELFFETSRRTTRDYHSGEAYGEWETIYECSLQKISRNKDLLDRWNFESIIVPDEVYNAANLYVVVVTYSSGDTFGKSEGNIALAFATENPDEAIDAKKAIELEQEWEYQDRGYGSKKENKIDKKDVWFEKYKNHPKKLSSYNSWSGYFENVTDVKIEFRPVIG